MVTAEERDDCQSGCSVLYGQRVHVRDHGDWGWNDVYFRDGWAVDADRIESILSSNCIVY